MTEQQLQCLLQNTYFDNIDNARPERAVEAFTPEAQWQHTQVWAHDGHNARHTDRLVGRAALLAFLSARVPQMQAIQIKHQVDEVIVSAERGAFRARVIGPDGRSVGFMGWVEISGDKLKTYTVVPEAGDA